MPSLFRRRGSEIWTASLRLWDSERGRWIRVQKSTGVTDRKKAQQIAEALEKASQDTKSGQMDHEKARALVSTVLELAGHRSLEKIPGLLEFAEKELTGRRRLSEASRKKYRTHHRRLSAWKKDAPLPQWDFDTWNSYYDYLLSELWVTTANTEISYWSGILRRALSLGYIHRNPIPAIDRLPNDTAERKLFNWPDVQRLVMNMESKGEEGWAILTLLGWNTGARIDDLYNVGPENLKTVMDVANVLEFDPQKKKNRGKNRTVRIPLPDDLADRLRAFGSLRQIHTASNVGGKVSDKFIRKMKRAGIDPCPIEREGARNTFHLLSFHSLRHSLSTRLQAIGCPAEIRRMITNHESNADQAYLHDDLLAMKNELQKLG